MSVQLPPNSTGSVVATLTSGGKEFQQAILVDATTPTQGLAISAGGAAAAPRRAAASGTAVSGNPVLIGGQDGTNAVTAKTASAANLAAGATGGNGAAIMTVRAGTGH